MTGTKIGLMKYLIVFKSVNGVRHGEGRISYFHDNNEPRNDSKKYLIGFNLIMK